MNYLSVEYTLSTKSLDLYLSGCNGSPKCLGCHNPESWDFNNGQNILFAKIKITAHLISFNKLIENIMIFGGEPLDQDHTELIDLLIYLKSTNKKTWLFTRYELEEIPKEIISYCDYIKTGRYLPELTVDDNIQEGIKLATSNQKIIKIERNNHE